MQHVETETVTRVYRYGLRPPIDGAERISQQMRAAHAYYNRLVEIDRHRRDRLRSLEISTKPLRDSVSEARAVVDGLVEEIRVVRKKARGRAESTEIRAKLKAARETMRERTRALIAARRDGAAALQAERDAINEEFLAARRAARPGISKLGAEGVVAGTYQLVEDAVAQASASTPLWDGDQPMDPRFKRWTGEGVVSVQIPGGLPVSAQLVGGSTQVAIVPPATADGSRRDPGSRRSQLRKRVVLWLRVGSDGGQPIWGRWPMVLHRPLPTGGRVQRATVRLTYIGPKPEWSVEFTVRMGAPAATHGAGGAVAIDVGWRNTDRGLRLGITCDEHGVSRELVMSAHLRESLTIPSRLRAIRDTNMELARANLVEWLASAGGVPEWLSDASETLGQWRSQARLAALAIRWRTNRFDGDARAFDSLEAWRVQDKHLWLWESSQRASAIRDRRELFRRFAADLARTYGTLVLEKFDLRQMAKRNATGEDAAENETARANRQLAGISILRGCLRNAFLARGGRVIDVDPANTTRTCSVCGVIETWDAAADIRHTCANGHGWDQDANAARNLIERWSGSQGPDPARTDVPPTESRRDRVRRKREEKVARMGLSQDRGAAPMAAVE